MCVPLMFINLLVAWIWLQLLYLPLPCSARKRDSDEASAGDNVRRLLQSRYDELGSITRHEKSVLVMFIILVLLWMTRSPGFVSGWGELFPAGVADATPALLVSLIMFVLPVSADGGPMLTWTLVQTKLAWGVIILLGGGFALAEGAERLRSVKYY